VSDGSKAKTIGVTDLEKVRDPHVRMSLELQAAFGLRREEAIKFAPSYADKGIMFCSSRLLISNNLQPGSRAELPAGAHYPGLSDIEVCHGNESHSVSTRDVGV
jgi:hypothetical protein